MTRQNSSQINRVCLIGMGLIGSSIARAIKEPQTEDHGKVAHSVVCTDADPNVRERVKSLQLADEVFESVEAAIAEADLIILCVPVGAIPPLVAQILPVLLSDSARLAAAPPIISDVGSTKQSVVKAFTPLTEAGIPTIPAHPVAGTEKSGPDAGFAELFIDRWCVLTPASPKTPREAIERLKTFWQGLGAMPEVMTPDLHDQIFAITSHIPQIMAYTAVGTIHDVDSTLNENAFRFAASGFRDMTRLAGSDPTMWRDVYLNNKQHVLEMLQLFSENLFALQRAIRFDDGEALHRYFTQTREIHQRVVSENQAEMEDVKQRRLIRARNQKQASDVKRKSPDDS